MVVGLLDNESPDSKRFTLVTPKSENDVRLQATLDNQNPTGLPVGAVRTQGLTQTLLVRLPMAYYMSIQPDASLMKIGLAAPTATVFGIVLNVGFFLWCKKREKIEGFVDFLDSFKVSEYTGNIEVR